MNPIRCAAYALLLAFVAPAWAVNKCTDANGKVSFQDAPCVGEGGKIDVRPAMQGATPVAPAAAAAAGKEGAFGPTWQRKHFLQNQGVPEARAAVERSQRDCNAPRADAVTQAGPLRNTLAQGSQFAQQRAAALQKEKAACEARTQELRERLEALEEELRSL